MRKIQQAKPRRIGLNRWPMSAIVSITDGKADILLCLIGADFVAKVLLHSSSKFSFGCTRDFRVKMWGTSSPDDKLTDDLRNAIGGHTNQRSSVEFFNSRKISSQRSGTFATISANSRPEQVQQSKQAYSITSSAVASIDGGTVRPSIRAVSALMTSSNLSDCTTRKSAGFSLLRMRPAFRRGAPVALLDRASRPAYIPKA